MFENDYLMHYGIKGQKWGVRRYQNADGSLTTAGRARYSKGSGKRAKYGVLPEALVGAAGAGVVGLMGYNVAQHMKANKQSAKNVMYDLERSGSLKGLTADQIKKVEKEVKSSVRRNSANSPVYSTEASAKTAGERVASMYKGSGKRAKYGSEGMSSEVYNLNKKIDKYNKQLQNTRVMNDSIRGTSTGKMAGLSGVKGVVGNAASVAPTLATAPIGASAAALGVSGLINAAMGAGVTAGMKRGASKRTNEKRIEKKIKKLQEKRNALDPRQANRQGSLLSQEEYNKLYNAGVGSMYGFGAGGLLGGLAGGAIGSKSKKSRDAEYENYKNSAVSYGSKKKKRAR